MHLDNFIYSIAILGMSLLYILDFGIEIRLELFYNMVYIPLPHPLPPPPPLSHLSPLILSYRSLCSARDTVLMGLYYIPIYPQRHKRYRHPSRPRPVNTPVYVVPDHNNTPLTACGEVKGFLRHPPASGSVPKQWTDAKSSSLSAPIPRIAGHR